MNYAKMPVTEESPEESPIVSKIEEAVRLGFNTEEGAKLVGMYDDGYRVIVQLLSIRDRNKDPMVRSKANDFLTIVNANRGPGEDLSDIRAFIATYFEKRGKPYSWRKVCSPGKYDIEARLKDLLDRPDLDESVKKRSTELLNTIVDGRMMTHLLREALSLTTRHRTTLKKLSKHKSRTKSLIHAIDHACNSCENLSDIQRSFVPENERAALIARLCDAIAALANIQSKLIGG